MNPKTSFKRNRIINHNPKDRSHCKPYPTNPYVNASFSFSSDHNFDVTNPYTKEKLLSLPFCDENVVENTIACAYQYQHEFQNSSAQFRSSLLQSIETLLQKYEQDIAVCITEENGKPLAESLAEVRYTIGYFRWYKSSCERINGKILAQDPASSSNMIRVQKRPVGVCAMITPWNFPLAMLGRKVAMALAAGCCVIAKPSEETRVSPKSHLQVPPELVVYCKNKEHQLSKECPWNLEGMLPLLYLKMQIFLPVLREQWQQNLEIAGKHVLLPIDF